MFGTNKWSRVFATACLVAFAKADERTHMYAPNEELVVWTAKIGPRHNPHETYAYERLPFCELKDATSAKRDVTIGEALEGHHYVSSPRVEIHFGETIDGASPRAICNQTLTAAESDELIAAVKTDYWYLLYVDDLPLSGPLGSVTVLEDDPTGGVGIYTHRHFIFKHNGARVVVADVEPSNLASLGPGDLLRFTYSVEWGETPVRFQDRFKRYLDASFFEHRVHWFSVMNSFVLCLFLCIVVAGILARTLKNDLGKYAASEVDELESLDRADDSGWKQIHGDVFRRPQHLMLFSVLHGTGCHIGGLCVALLLLASVNSYYAKKGMTATAAIAAYVATQIINGWAAGHLFKLYGGKGWKRAMIHQLVFLPSLLFVIFTIVNTTALVYGSSMALPFAKVAILLGTFLLLCVPLHIVGSVIGRRQSMGTSIPCRVHQLKRPIPAKSPFFLPCMTVAGGVAPFGCIFIEMYFIFSSLWNAKVYYVYSFLIAVLILVTCVMACVSITCVYILLNAEDFRWAWVAFFSSASTGLYVFAYAVYYFHHSTMTGFMQSLYYFATSTFLSLCVGLTGGSIGYFGTSQFVWRIYRNIKSD